MEQLRRDGVGLAYEEAGSGAPPIVLVHDLGSDHTCFAPQFEHFRCRHRVVAVDLRGHGQSEGPKGTCTIDLLADDLAWLCYELGFHRPVILGKGLGGLVALDLAARYPDLPAGIVIVAADSILRQSTTPSALSRGAATSIVKSRSGGDEAAAPSGCTAPVLRVATVTREEELARGEAGPQGPASPGYHCQGPPGMPLPKELTLLVEGFLAELVGRTPPLVDGLGDGLAVVVKGRAFKTPRGRASDCRS